MIMIREEGDPSPEEVEYRHGLTPPMRDARRRRFRREPNLNVFYFNFSFFMGILHLTVSFIPSVTLNPPHLIY